MRPPSGLLAPDFPAFFIQPQLHWLPFGIENRCDRRMRLPWPDSRLEAVTPSQPRAAKGGQQRRQVGVHPSREKARLGPLGRDGIDFDAAHTICEGRDGSAEVDELLDVTQILDHEPVRRGVPARDQEPIHPLQQELSRDVLGLEGDGFERLDTVPMPPLYPRRW